MLFQKPKNEIKDLPKESPKVARIPKIDLAIDKAALKKLNFVTVAFSHVERAWFPTEDAYIAEVEVEDRSAEVAEEIKKLGIDTKCTPGNQYFLTNLLVDKPDLVLNLVDTLKGKDTLQTSVPAALELSGVPYTGAGMDGMVIGNDRNLTKRLLMAYDVPTPAYQFIRRSATRIHEDLGLPLIVKLCGSGARVASTTKPSKKTTKTPKRKATL